MTSPLVRAHDLHFSYGSTEIVAGADLELAAGEEWALTGRSGSGKTTLLLVLAGLLPPNSGTIEWPGLTDLRRQIGVVFQAPSLLPDLTARENVTLPLRLQGESRVAAEVAAVRALGVLGLTGDVVDELPAGLSGGQQQRVGIARVLAGRPQVVLADEPTGALDRHTAREVVTVLRDEVRALGGALVVATHDEELAGLLATRLRLEAGRLQPVVPA